MVVVAAPSPSNKVRVATHDKARLERIGRPPEVLDAA
jgi:hypothetical protein